MSIVSGEKDLLNQLLSAESVSLKVQLVRRIRNSVIGNRKRKRLFLSSQAIQILTKLWRTNPNTIELVTESVTIIGSLALDNEDAVSMLLQDGDIQLILQGVCSSEVGVVTACLKALRSIYSVETTPPQLIYQDDSVARQLISLLLYPSPLNESAANVLSKTCQTTDQQNFLFSNGIVSNIFPLLLSPSPKVMSAGLVCLCAVVRDNSFTSTATMECMVPGSEGVSNSLLALLINLMTYSPSHRVKADAAQCVAQLQLSIGVSPDDRILTTKLLPCLAGLCTHGVDDIIRMKAANTIESLVANNISLQQMAASTNSLLTLLSDFFQHKPTGDEEEIDQHCLLQFNRLRQSAFLLLACLASSLEDIRFQVITKSRVMQYITDAMECEMGEVKVAAAKCLLSLSRSPKLLRTYLSDTEVWRCAIRMLSSPDEECVKVSSGLISNLVHSFCPSREPLVVDGIIPTLSHLVNNSGPVIQLNAIWGLMNCSRDGNLTVIKQIRASLPITDITRILQSRCTSERLQLKCLGLLMNLTQSPLESDTIMEECPSIVEVLGSVMMIESLTDAVYEQVLCVLVNVSNGNCKWRNRIAECDVITSCISQLLRGNQDDSVLVACCKLVHNLSDISCDNHTHRQNCLEEAGVQHFLQKLEMVNNSQIQEMARQVLESLQTASL